MLSMVGVAYAGFLDKYKFFRRAAVSPVDSLECTSNSDCRTGQVCYRNTCTNVQQSEPTRRGVDVPLPSYVREFNSRRVAALEATECTLDQWRPYEIRRG